MKFEEALVLLKDGKKIRRKEELLITGVNVINVVRHIAR